MDEAKNKREKRMRRSILRLVDASRPTPLKGGWIADILESQADGIDDAEQVLRLCQDLVNLGLITGTDTRTLKTQRAGLEWMAYSATAKGTGLLAGAEPVCGLVEDERI